MSSIRFAHFRGYWGAATVAYRWVGDNTVRYGLSFCSPKDQFNKKRGRLIAENRLDAYSSPRESVFSGELEINRTNGLKTSDQLYDQIIARREDFPSYLRHWPDFRTDVYALYEVVSKVENAANAITIAAANKE